MEEKEFFEQIKDRKFFCFDTETTGLYPLKKYAPDNIKIKDSSGSVTTVSKEDYQYDDMIEIGFVLSNPTNDKIIDKQNYLLKPEKPISDDIFAITGISNEIVEKEGLSKEAIYNILDPILDENPILIAYNAKFDITFLYKLMNEINPDKYRYFNFDVIDVMTIFANYFPFSKVEEIGCNYLGVETKRKYGHRLVYAVKTLCNKDLRQSHRALDDIEETLNVLNELKKHYNIYDFINILGYQPSTNTFRYFDYLKPYHVTILPLGYNGNDYLHGLIKGDFPSEYRRLLIPKWMWEQNFTPGLRKMKNNNIKTKRFVFRPKIKQLSLFDEKEI